MTDEEKNSRAAWVALTRVCKELDLPTPVLEPGKLGGYRVTVGTFLAFNDKMSAAINSCIDFCDGYRAGRTPVTVSPAYLVCKKCGDYADFCICGDMS